MHRDGRDALPRLRGEDRVNTRDLATMLAQMSDMEVRVKEAGVAGTLRVTDARAVQEVGETCTTCGHKAPDRDVFVVTVTP